MQTHRNAAYVGAKQLILKITGVVMKTDFSPLKNGFHFGNNFVNRIIQTSFGKIESRGRCGGMAFASLDYYFSNISIPSHEPKDFPGGDVPPDGSILGDYIYERALYSLFTFSSYKFFDWSLKRNVNSGRRSISYKTKHEEFHKLKKSIDEGRPVVLGLIGAERVAEICMNHQVVAYGYDFEPKDERIVIYIYDSNVYDKEITIVSDRRNPHFIESNGQEWRGFFVQDYRHKSPKYRDIVVSGHEEAQALKKALSIKNIGQFPANTKYLQLMQSGEIISRVLMPGEEVQIAP